MAQNSRSVITRPRILNRKRKANAISLSSPARHRRSGMAIGEPHGWAGIWRRLLASTDVRRRLIAGKNIEIRFHRRTAFHFRVKNINSTRRGQTGTIVAGRVVRHKPHRVKYRIMELPKANTFAKYLRQQLFLVNVITGNVSSLPALSRNTSAGRRRYRVKRQQVVTDAKAVLCTLRLSQCRVTWHCGADNGFGPQFHSPTVLNTAYFAVHALRAHSNYSAFTAEV